MSPKKIAGILIVLFFIPTTYFGTTFYNSESPGPMMVFEGPDEMMEIFKITPISCSETDSGLTESHFKITNTHKENYEVKTIVSFNDNFEVLYEKEASIRLLAGQTKDQIHLSDKAYDNPICVVHIDNWSQIT